MFVAFLRNLKQRFLLLLFLLLLLSGCNSQPPSIRSFHKTSVPLVRITEFSVPIPLSNNSTTIGGITAGPDGNIWFAQLDIIWRLNPTNGRFTSFSVMKSNTAYDSSEEGGNILVGPDGKLWFDEADGQIGNISPKGVITEFLPPNGSSIGIGVVGPDSKIWFTDPIKNLIGNFSLRNPRGTVMTFPLSNLSDPGEIISGPDGNFWFTLGGGQDRIGRITPNGIITIFSFPGSLGSAIGSLTVGPYGNIWFTDANDNTIGRFNPTNPEQTVTEFHLPASDNGSPGHPGGTPAGIIMGPDGNIWFTEYSGHKIGRIGTNGTIIEFPLPTLVEAPATIIVGPDHNLWFTEGNTYKIGHITIGK